MLRAEAELAVYIWDIDGAMRPNKTYQPSSSLQSLRASQNFHPAMGAAEWHYCIPVYAVGGFHVAGTRDHPGLHIKYRFCH